eukprot:CAMPEP_0198499184 /NCGR_PEP_ID=MMETSP1462-20131121/7461_1 /TAXON_ID=1333877 /ORGANISM="Brandtodinium nutriculum, Strain RCC3387" /LENGTH=46 /DNA_ID= /DNA_START= /DNA_END= /DNA_ORIENTATION=
MASTASSSIGVLGKTFLFNQVARLRTCSYSLAALAEGAIAWGGRGL